MLVKDAIAQEMLLCVQRVITTDTVIFVIFRLWMVCYFEIGTLPAGVL